MFGEIYRFVTAAALGLGLLLVLGAGGAPAHAGDALVAVAANFKDIVERIQLDFEAATDHRLTLSVGSTGMLYAQIVNGAPYDVMLSADQARPIRLEAEGQAVAGSRFTYAVGRLVLWSADATLIPPGDDRPPALLTDGGFRRLALAQPDLAPYGAAARDVLQAYNVWDSFRPKLVMGENIGQTFAMVATGNAELGFVAWSSVLARPEDARGSAWLPPQGFYAPVRQDAVLLSRAADNPAATAFLAFLQCPAARAVIIEFGYGLAD